MEEIVNRVASSSLITFDLKDHYVKGERVLYDMKQNLFQELVLKENDFRDFIKDNDWGQYKGKHVAITCSADAIIPTWAYMLLITRLEPIAETVLIGDLERLEEELFFKQLDLIDFNSFEDSRIVIKGCSEIDIPESVYGELTRRLRPVAKSIMFGEPCSTVPVYKKPKKT